jgi:hypothetical protein
MSELMERNTTQFNITLASIVLLDTALQHNMTTACIIQPHLHHTALPQPRRIHWIDVRRRVHWLRCRWSPHHDLFSWFRYCRLLIAHGLGSDSPPNNLLSHDGRFVFPYAALTSLRF